MYHYDSDFHRQRQRERMAEIRDEYQRVQASSEPRARARFRRYARSAWSQVRVIPRRAPVFRA
jgi:hypothetical protein